MSEVKRITTEDEEYVELHQKTHESWMEALDRLLGIDEPPMTEERVKKIVEEIVEKKIEEIRYR